MLQMPMREYSTHKAYNQNYWGKMKGKANLR